MLSCTSSNKLTKGKSQRVPQNLDNPKNGRTLEHGWALGHLPCCADNYIWCESLQELAPKISVQVSSVRPWVWSNTVPNAYGTVSFHVAIVKIPENRVIVNVYLQELCYILLVMNLLGITVKCMVYVRSLYLYGALQQWETVRWIVLLLYSYVYYMLLWRLLNFINKNH